MQNIPYPRFVWPNSGWWFTVIGAIAGLAVILYPDISDFELMPRIIISVCFTVCPAVLLLLAFILRYLIAVTNRARALTDAQEKVRALESDLLATRDVVRALLLERSNRRAYTIVHCYIYADRTFIALRKRTGPTLMENQRIAVVDTQTSAVMGHFIYRRTEGENYVCEQDGHMDALWLGFIRQAGTQYSVAPPEALAFAIMESTGDTSEQ